jgi:hypothetical protein
MSDRTAPGDEARRREAGGSAGATRRFAAQMVERLAGGVEGSRP